MSALSCAGACPTRLLGSKEGALLLLSVGGRGSSTAEVGEGQEQGIRALDCKRDTLQEGHLRLWVSRWDWT